MVSFLHKLCRAFSCSPITRRLLPAEGVNAVRFSGAFPFALAAGRRTGIGIRSLLPRPLADRFGRRSR